MYNKLNNEISFPHVIPTDTLGGMKHFFNKHVNGGTCKLADLGLSPNKFFGGRVAVLGWIKEYGMWACADVNYPPEIAGFYVQDPAKLTPLGKELIKEYFSTKTVIFEIIPEKQLTPEEKREREKVKQYYKDHGMSPFLVDKSTVEELKNLQEAIASGRSEKPLAIIEPVTVAPMATSDIQHIHVGGNVSERILEKRPRIKKAE